MSLTAQEKRLRLARTQLHELDPVPARVVKLEECDDLENIHPVTFLDLPDGYAVSTEWMPKESITVRMLEIMAVEQWRGQALNDTMQRDHEASLMLMLMLAKHHGYSSIIASVHHVDASALYKGDDASRGLSTIPDLEASLDRFFDTLASLNYEGGGVYLARQSSPNDSDMKLFEMKVHPTLAGWKLPEHLVETRLEAVRERVEQAKISYGPKQAA